MTAKTSEEKVHIDSCNSEILEPGIGGKHKDCYGKERERPRISNHTELGFWTAKSAAITTKWCFENSEEKLVQPRIPHNKAIINQVSEEKKNAFWPQDLKSLLSTYPFSWSDGRICSTQARE